MGIGYQSEQIQVGITTDNIASSNDDTHSIVCPSLSKILRRIIIFGHVFIASLDIDGGIVFHIQAKLQVFMQDPPIQVLGRGDIRNDHFIRKSLSNHLIGDSLHMAVKTYSFWTDCLQPSHS